MRYFDGIRFHFTDHVPACSAWIDRVFRGYYALNFAAAGRIRWQQPGGEMQTLAAPLAWWTWPGRRFIYGRCESDTWDHYYITFSGRRAARMFSSDLAPSLRDPATAFAHLARPQPFRHGFESLLAALRRPVPDTDLAVHLLEGLLLSLREPAQLPAADTHLEQIDQLIAAMRLRPQATWDFTEQAERLGMSLVHLRRLFRARTTLSIHQFLIRARMDRAQELLRNTADPIKQIAAESGYPDVFHFTKLFRAHAQIPPGAYRREIRSLG